MFNSYHFIGIGGIGMSGLARIVLSRKGVVTGSDIGSNAVIEALIKTGATVHIGHSKEYIKPEMTVVYSTDIKKDNPEYQAALDLKCHLMHRSELLQKLMQNQHSLAVAGSHGKTTTSSLLTWVLKNANKDPSYAIGGVIPQLKSNAEHGHGPHFVAEACESDGTFSNYKPYGAIITNVDLDHMDYYLTAEALEKAFINFISNVSLPQHLFWCGDDERLQKFGCRGISYGFGEQCQLQASRFSQDQWTSCFDVKFNGKEYKNVSVALTGKHNALNALAVFGMAVSLGVDEDLIRDGLMSFRGVLRRCEKKGEVQGVLFLDDYGHHPTEIKATLKAIRSAVGERRLIVIYQPHRYSRAKDCMGLYGSVFNEADLVFINDIYSAREQPITGVTHEKILEEVQHDLKDRCQYVGISEVTAKLVDLLRPHDVVLTLGAGDVTKICPEIISLLSLKSIPRLKVGVICGGASVEHEISVNSAAHIFASLNPTYYDVEKFYISRKGEWQNNSSLFATPSASTNKIPVEVFAKLMECEILFPVLHGTYGEDGTIQGFFEMISKAYVGCDYRSAAICMDKIVTKKLFLNADIATSPFVGFDYYDWKMDQKNIEEQIDHQLRYPLFVKPSHLGSSVGVHKVLNKEQLIDAVEDAFRFDTSLLVENGIVGQEVEFAVLGNEKITVFPPGEICTNGDVYDYERKYGENSMKVLSKISLPQPLLDEGMALAERAYKATNCIGMARIDMFLDKEGKYWLNEINPIPGFTEKSLYPQMCAANGLDNYSLIDRLIVLGLHRRRLLDRLELQP